jgi:dihydroorotate dehydrogenase
LGFGFVEVGTVTPQPQPGNDKPRLFRLPAQRALINRMGFNNEGVDAMHARLEAARRRGWCDGVVVGVNLGKNKDTPLEHAVSDYVFGMRRLYLQADYFTLNLSSPNTPGLRRLQGGAALGNLLTEIKSQQALLAQEHQRVVPVLIKVAPDLSTSELKEVAGLCVHHQIDGVIATNTTLSREGVAGARHGDESGGLSGAPVHGRAVATVARLRTLLPRHVPVIGVGGIDSAIAGERMLEAGADLLQIYTGFIYEGPTLVHKLRRLCGSRRTSD